MIVNLKVSAASHTVITAGCPKTSEYLCGVLYRA